MLVNCRIPLYATSLLLAARKHPNFLQGLQRHLAAFMAEPAAKRYSLPPMPREVVPFQHSWSCLRVACTRLHSSGNTGASVGAGHLLLNQRPPHGLNGRACTCTSCITGICRRTASHIRLPTPPHRSASWRTSWRSTTG